MLDEKDWDARMEALWARLDAMPADDFVAAVDALATERSEKDARGLFERACARDSVGFEAAAEPLYRAALAAGTLDPYRRTRATLQLASTLRLLGRLEESEALLLGELGREDAMDLRDEARALLALTWLEKEAPGEGRWAAKAAGLLLATLAPHLTRYQRSMGRNAARWADMEIGGLGGNRPPDGF